LTFNPYDILEVERDADTPAIRKAYRKKAKAAHPDCGGDPGKFHQVSRAVAVLTDPKKRDRFDRTGVVDEDPVDSARAAALGLIESFIAAEVSLFVQTGMSVDPRRRLILVEFKTKMRDDIKQMLETIEKGKGIRKYTEDVMRRFATSSPENLIRKMFERRLRAIDAECENLLDAIGIREKAIEIAATYSFDRSEHLDMCQPIMRESSPR
jgi:curved DNA-binding protein CbpA